MATNSTTWATPQFSITLPSSSFYLGLKKKPIIECAINFTKQPYQQTLISKDTLETPQPQPTLPPQWNPFQRALAMAIDTVECALVSLQKPLPKSVDPQVQLAGNFAPVPEQPVIPSLPIAGTIPDCINGVYLRNGPNLFFNPISGHHFFDGDDMVHAVTITMHMLNAPET